MSSALRCRYVLRSSAQVRNDGLRTLLRCCAEITCTSQRLLAKATRKGL